MSVAPPAVEIKVAPSRLMSSLSIRNVFQVLAWSLWSPYSFIDYGYGLLHRNTVGHEQRLPARRRDLRPWWKDSPHHRTWLYLAGSVTLLLFSGLLALLLLMITPLTALSARQIAANVFYYLLLLGFTWAPALLFVRSTAVRTGNMGYLLAAALPGGIALALLWLLIWWGRYTSVYLAADPALRNAIFLVWGYGIGFFASLIHAIWPLELADMRKLFGWYGLTSLVILFIILSASGLTWGTLNTLFTLHAAALRAALWCCFGLLMGLLRPLEYLVLVGHRQPNASRWGRARVWWMPGSTLLPVDTVQNALSRQLDTDWEHGLRVAARLSAVSAQQAPLVLAMHHHLAACGEENLPGLLYNVGDSGAPCAPDTIKPPVVPAPTLRQRLSRKTPPPPPPKPQSPQRLAFEMELADILRHPQRTPEFQGGGRAQAVRAAYWYYVEGYLYEAVDALPQISSVAGPTPVPASAELGEMEKLTDTFRVLMDLKAASSKAVIDKLPKRPDVLGRKSTWSIIDHFVRAARWAWRARQSQGATRVKCWDAFGRELGVAERLADNEELAERKLALGVALHWRRQVRSLLEVIKPVEGFVRIKLRRWDRVYPQLAADYPWRSADDQLHETWRPGHTAVTWVYSQPLAMPGAAIRMAARNNARPTRPVTIDLANCRNAAVRAGLWRTIYTEVANRLKETPADPAHKSSDQLIQWIAQLCHKHHQQCVLLVIRNADLLNSVFQPTSRADRLVELLCRMEREIPNFALTLESSAALNERQQWEHRMGSVPLHQLYLPLLTLRGVGGWLKRQFDPGGVFVDRSAVYEVSRLTGGHPYLLDHLAHGMAAAYNGHLRESPPGPVLSRKEVGDASVATSYLDAVQRYGQALASVLRRREDEAVRVILDLLAGIKVDQDREVDAAELKKLSDDSFYAFSLDAIAKMLASWEALQVVEGWERSGVRVYRLRSLSFAQWLQRQGLTP